MKVEMRRRAARVHCPDCRLPFLRSTTINELSANAPSRRHPDIQEVVQCPLPRQTRKPLRQLWAGRRARRFYPATTTGTSKLSRHSGFRVFRTSMDFRGEPNEAKPSKQTQRSYFRTRASRVALF